MTTTQTETKIIRRYVDVKLYDCETSTYTTLKKIVEEIAAGRTVQVLDNVSKLDITATTLLGALVETEEGTIDTSTLMDILRAGGLIKYVNGIQTIARLSGV